MPAITSETTVELQQLELELIVHWNAVEDNYETAIQSANQAVVHAWEVGRRLIRAKEMLGHGNFGIWQEKMKIPQPTAFRYMKLAASYATADLLPENKREAYLAIGLLPEKDVVTHHGNVELKPFLHHIQFVNRWNNWLNQVKIGKIKMDEEKVKQDLRPTFEWMKELYGE